MELRTLREGFPKKIFKIFAQQVPVGSGLGKVFVLKVVAKLVFFSDSSFIDSEGVGLEFSGLISKFLWSLPSLLSLLFDGFFLSTLSSEL